MSSLFKEKQRFLKTWHKIILSIFGIIIFVWLFVRFNLEKPIGKDLISDFQLIVFSFVLVFIIVLLFISKLSIFINQYGIFINFFPFLKKHIVWYGIKEAKIIDCDFIRGWGINKFTNYGTVFKIKGNKGLHIILKNDKEFLIATKHSVKLKKVVETYRSVHDFE